MSNKLKYKVTVTRHPIQNSVTFDIEAADQDEAVSIAYEQAADYVFHDIDAEYSIEDIKVTFDNLDEVKKAVDAGHKVFWSTQAYTVVKDGDGYGILCTINDNYTKMHDTSYSTAYNLKKFFSF